MKRPLRNRLALGALVGASLSSANAGINQFVAESSGLTDKPIKGMSQTTDDYFLTGKDGTFSLRQDFSGDNQETAEYSNFTTMQDAASGGDNYTFQLGTDNGIYKVDNSAGNIVNFGTLTALDAENNSIGIGALFDLDKLYSFNLDGNGNLTGDEWDLTTNSKVRSFSLGDLSQYGEVTGAEAYQTPEGHIGFLISTKDSFVSDENYILDYNADGSFTGEGLTITGSRGDLEDIAFQNGTLAAGYDDFFFGRVELTDYQGAAVPEPGTAALLTGLAALTASGLYRRGKE